ncbi:unnamed protein product, partial [Musa hybrid cultivar]
LRGPYPGTNRLSISALYTATPECFGLTWVQSSTQLTVGVQLAKGGGPRRSFERQRESEGRWSKEIVRETERERTPVGQDKQKDARRDR